MRMGLIASFAICITAMGCQEPPEDTTCWLRPGTVAWDAPTPAQMIVINEQKWCGYFVFQTLGDGRHGFARGRVVTAPANGRTLVRTVKSNLTFFYKPKPGFTGEDAFVIEVDGNGSFTQTVKVRVDPPQSTAPKT